MEFRRGCEGEPFDRTARPLQENNVARLHPLIWAAALQAEPRLDCLETFEHRRQVRLDKDGDMDVRGAVAIL